MDFVVPRNELMNLWKRAYSVDDAVFEEVLDLLDKHTILFANEVLEVCQNLAQHSNRMIIQVEDIIEAQKVLGRRLGYESSGLVVSSVKANDLTTESEEMDDSDDWIGEESESDEDSESDEENGDDTESVDSIHESCEESDASESDGEVEDELLTHEEFVDNTALNIIEAVEFDNRQ